MPHKSSSCKRAPEPIRCPSHVYRVAISLRCCHDHSCPGRTTGGRTSGRRKYNTPQTRPLRKEGGPYFTLAMVLYLSPPQMRTDGVQKPTDMEKKLTAGSAHHVHQKTVIFGVSFFFFIRQIDDPEKELDCVHLNRDFLMNFKVMFSLLCFRALNLRRLFLIQSVNPEGVLGRGGGGGDETATPL